MATIEVTDEQDLYFWMLHTYTQYSESFIFPFLTVLTAFENLQNGICCCRFAYFSLILGCYTDTSFLDTFGTGALMLALIPNLKQYCGLKGDVMLKLAIFL